MIEFQTKLHKNIYYDIIFDVGKRKGEEIKYQYYEIKRMKEESEKQPELEKQ